jgi:regulator of protease activity HflC (stomatin/prohibitin superfamily)
VGLRISLNANYRFTNAQQAVKTVKDPLDFLLREIQFGLGVCVGARSLDALLEDKGVMGAAVFEHVHDRFAALGIDVLDIGVKDVILPDDPVDSAPVYAGLDGVLNQLARIRL